MVLKWNFLKTRGIKVLKWNFSFPKKKNSSYSVETEFIQCTILKKISGLINGTRLNWLSGWSFWYNFNLVEYGKFCKFWLWSRIWNRGGRWSGQTLNLKTWRNGELAKIPISENKKFVIAVCVSRCSVVCYCYKDLNCRIVWKVCFISLDITIVVIYC